MLSRTSTSRTDTLDIYSPLASLVEYENRLFSTGFANDRTQFQGEPTEENTKAWEELTEVGIIKLDRDQAAQLPNQTVEWNQEPGTYLAAVGMFHQLHCVDALRRNMFASSKGNAALDRKAIAHLDHCADYLRQVLTCHGDVSIVSFHWNEAIQKNTPIFDGLQHCRKFEPIFEWTKVHRAGDLRP
ncbi:hypothetical protein NA57DRAFT_78770 [Rhizodiscina lignyota]|uniref:Cyclochlorotine biosynthesis protein O n=1 Tax=Rhizodiscina lignyota TaxID=1504668 RepID=A0A9P4I8N6_9PEZI|nr:hypothetical protein NA57DRAFT_78770 [Rhizodiscina lignyota]